MSTSRCNIQSLHKPGQQGLHALESVFQFALPFFHPGKLFYLSTFKTINTILQLGYTLQGLRIFLFFRIFLAFPVASLTLGIG